MPRRLRRSRVAEVIGWVPAAGRSRATLCTPTIRNAIALRDQVAWRIAIHKTKASTNQSNTCTSTFELPTRAGTNDAPTAVRPDRAADERSFRHLEMPADHDSTVLVASTTTNNTHHRMRHQLSVAEKTIPATPRAISPAPSTLDSDVAPRAAISDRTTPFGWWPRRGRY